MNNATDVRYLLLSYLEVLWRKRRLILITMLCMPFLGLILSKMAPKKYEASTSLATFNSIPAFLKEVNSIPDLESQFSGIKAYITSPDVLKKVALQAGLLNSNDNDSDVQEVVKSLSKEISVSSVGRNVIEIKLTSGTPKNMVAILSALSADLITEYLKPITASVQSLTVILNKEMQAQEKKVNEAIQRVNDFKSKQEQVLQDPEAFYTNQLKTLSDTIAANETNYKTALQQKKWLESSFSLSGSEIADLDRQLSENNTNLNEMKKIYAPNYPGIREAEKLAKQLKSDREQLYKKMASNNKTNPKIETQISDQSLNTEQYASLTAVELKKHEEAQQKVTQLKEVLDSLYKQKESLMASLKKTNEIQNQLVLLTKTVREHQTSYDELKRQYNLAKMSTQIDYKDQLSPIKIVAAPQEPLSATGGRSLGFLMAIALFFGLCLSIGLAISLDLMDNRVRKKSTLQGMSEAGVIARLGHLNAQ